MTLCGRRTPRGRATKDAGAVTCPACGQVLQREEDAARGGRADAGEAT